MLSDKKELLVLEIISAADEPLGSWNLVERFKDEGVSVSPATIGRLLNRLEARGLLRKEKFRGRMITDEGEEAIRVSHELNQRNYYKRKLDEMINTKVLKNYIMVLEARKAIERTTASLAAQYATEEEILQMEDILRTQTENYRRSLSITKVDLDFHKLIAKASRNTVLESLYRIIALSGQQSELFEFIRHRVNAPYMSSHHEILEAIKNHDPLQAEQCMVRHIESLCKDVNAYWHEYYSED